MVRISFTACTALALLLSITMTFQSAAADSRLRGLSESSIRQRRRLQMDNGGNMNNGGNDNNNEAPESSSTTLGQIYDDSLVNQGGDQGGDQGGNTDAPNDTPNEATPDNRGTSPNAVCADQPAEYVDVVIIGAGMAGIKAAATLRANDPSLSYVILESTTRVGGRVRSHDFGGVLVEDGANWILDFNDNPMMAMAQSAVPEFQFPINDYTDYKTFGEDGLPIDEAVLQTQNDRFVNAWQAAEGSADNQWAPDHESFPDNGVDALLAQQGWEIQPGQAGNLDYTIQWFWIDYEYATKDTSVRYFPYFIFPGHHVNDQRGYESLLQGYFQDNVDTTKLRSDARVSQVNYDENVSANGKTYKAVVSTANAAGGCSDYYAQRVISTVSTGVINNDLITFNPPLAYPHQEFSPYYMVQYVKIFYKFDNQFWDDNQLIRVVRDEQNRGKCHHWANMAAPGFLEGSNVIRCEIMTEAFEASLDPVTQELSGATLLDFLDPLRVAYGAENVPTPVDVYYPKLNKDRDFGFGAYSNWKTGRTFTQFAHMFGGVEDVVPYCEHNGCNSNGEWTMMISGSATCFEHSEYVHGGYFSGEKAANLVLKELGYEVPKDVSPCDSDSWQWLK